MKGGKWALDISALMRRLKCGMGGASCSKNMYNLEKFKGVFPAFYACYDEKGEISEKGIRELVRYFIKVGIKGTYVCGSSGECIYQGVAERKKTLEIVMDEVGSCGSEFTVIAHVACNNTRDSVELARHAESVGADAIASIPPIYFHLPDYAMAEYWNTISSAAPNTPFMIYNIPGCTGVTLSLDLFNEMKKNPRVIAVKNSSALVQDIQMFKEAGGENFLVYNGPDEQFIAGRSMGADGGIGGTYAVMPELFLKMDELFKKGDMEKAKAVQFAAIKIISVMYGGHANLYAVMKEVLKRQTGIDIGSVRAPLTALSEADMPNVEQAINLINAAKAQCVDW